MMISDSGLLFEPPCICSTRDVEWSVFHADIQQLQIDLTDSRLGFRTVYFTLIIVSAFTNFLLGQSRRLSWRKWSNV